MDRHDKHFADVETGLAKLLRERTGYEVADLDRDATFLELGFDSLFLIQFSQELKQRFGVKVSFRQLIEEISSVDALVHHLVDSQPAQPPASDDVGPQVAVGQAGASASKSAAAAQPSAAAAQPSAAAAQPIVPSAAVAVLPAPPSLPAATPLPTAVSGAPRMAAPLPSPAACTLPSAPAMSMTGIEQIILQQNALMAQHLAILQGSSFTAPPAPPLGGAAESGLCKSASSAACSQAADCHPVTPESASSAATETTDSPTAAPAAATPKATNKHERFGPYKPVRRGVGNGLTDQQQQHLSDFIERYTRRTAKSRDLAGSHRDHFADPRGVAGYRRIWKSMVYQIVVERTKGSKLWDIDGNEYVDIAMGFGVNLFGHSLDFVTKALHEQLDRGVEIGPQSPIAGEVAQLLCDFARKDRATFCNTGSEAVMAALRLARTVTGRSKFVFFNKDYHGNFDQVLVRSTRVGNSRLSSPVAPGVPQSFANNAIVLDYGTLEALQVIEQRADEIAAVLIESVQSADPFLQPQEFLHEIRRITRHKKIAMLMDEVITGFRAAQGGAQEWFDVWADMSTYGKVLGGGMPIGALAGSREYMDALDGGTWNYDDDSEPEADMTFFAGTFVRHPLGLAAALQVLRKLKEEGPELQLGLTERTSYLVQSLNAFFERDQFPIRVAQFASQFRFMFPPDLEYADMLYFHLLDRGIFTRGWGDNCFLSTEHSDQDIAHVIAAVKESCLEIRHGGFFPAASTAGSGLDEFSIDEKKNRLLPANPAIIKTRLLAASTVKLLTLVEIQPKGDLTPLFCPFAADGLTMLYHDLSDHLGDNQPVYGLNSPAILGLPFPRTLEELATGLVEDIREVQPHGPYLLAGYCSRGTLALEIAQQLIAAGENVAMLGLIETYNWLNAPSTNPTLVTKIRYEYQRIEFHLRNFLLLSQHDKKCFLNSKLNVARRRSKICWSSLASLFSRKRKHRPTELVNISEIWLKHERLAEAYVPRPYPGRLTHFRPCRDYECHLSTELEAAEVVYHRLNVYPAGMMAKPFVAELADQLQQTMRDSLAAVNGMPECPGSVLEESEREAVGA